MPVEPFLFEAEALTCIFGRGAKRVVAVDCVDFKIEQGEIVTIVGESGSGKTTLARMLLGLQRESSGRLLFLGRPITHRRTHFRAVQGVFQDPFGSFNQYYTVGNQLLDCYSILEKPPPKEQRWGQVQQALDRVKLNALEVENKFPFELSGGQLQRLMVARICIIGPQVLIADEPTSMVDACSRAEVLTSLLDLTRQLGMTIVFITHDLGLADLVSDRILVMYQGRIVEQGTTQQIVRAPNHAYTKKLISAVPTMDGNWLDR